VEFTSYAALLSQQLQTRFAMIFFEILKLSNFPILSRKLSNPSSCRHTIELSGGERLSSTSAGVIG